jgi:ABC-type sugar transport system ATPase subunit
MSAALGCVGLQRYLGEAESRTHVLRGITLDVPTGEVHAIVGPSGCGKSTLLYVLGLLDVPDAGEIAIGNEVVFSTEKGIYVPPEKRGLGMVFQTYAIWPHMNVFQNVAFPLHYRRRKYSRSGVVTRMTQPRFNVLKHSASSLKADPSSTCSSASSQKMASSEESGNGRAAVMSTYISALGSVSTVRQSGMQLEPPPRLTIFTSCEFSHLRR